MNPTLELVVQKKNVFYTSSTLFTISKNYRTVATTEITSLSLGHTFVLVDGVSFPRRPSATKEVAAGEGGGGGEGREHELQQHKWRPPGENKKVQMLSRRGRRKKIGANAQPRREPPKKKRCKCLAAAGRGDPLRCRRKCAATLRDRRAGHTADWPYGAATAIFCGDARVRQISVDVGTSAAPMNVVHLGSPTNRRLLQVVSSGGAVMLKECFDSRDGRQHRSRLLPDFVLRCLQMGGTQL